MRRSFNDEIIEEFAYDSAGRLNRASDGRTECTYEYDLRHQLVRETQDVNGQRHTVESIFDACGRRIKKSTSLDHEERVRFDVAGLPVEIALDGAAPICFRRDSMGAEIERFLPGGAVLQTSYDAKGEMDRRRLFSPVVGPRIDPQDPAWSGQTPGVVLDQGCARDGDGYVVSEWTGGRGTTTHSYDAAARVLSKLTEHARREIFSYDAADNLFDGAREYAAGGLLRRTASTEYRYDQENRLTEKRVARDGVEDVWRYAWDARGLLRSVIKPSGDRVEYTYDATARLVAKRVVRTDRSVSASTRFIWDGNDLAHELLTQSDPPSGSHTVERTYAYLPNHFAPLAHRTAEGSAEGSRDRGWAYYLNDSAHRPQVLMSGDGQVLARLDGQVWGRVEYEAGARDDTRLRFARQREDEDTGLFYNRYRHYDAVVGRYISPEPLGLLGGPRPFGYGAPNPVHYIDPNGLEGMRATAEGGGVSVTRGSAGTEQKDRADWRKHRGKTEVDDLHPAVRACLLPPSDSLEKARGGMRHPASCAEPRAVSDYLKKLGVPKDANPDKVREALEKMHLSAKEADDDNPRAPCANCSQFLANLMATYGAPHPSQIALGFDKPNTKSGPMSNFTPPPDGESGTWKSYEEARAAYEQRTGKKAADPHPR